MTNEEIQLLLKGTDRLSDEARIEMIRRLLEPFAGRTLPPETRLHLGFAIEDMRTIIRHSVEDKSESCCRGGR